MSPGNGQPKAPTPEQLAAQVAQQRMMAAAYAHQQRQATATALLSGILSGLYTNPTDLIEDFGDRAVKDALAFADKLIEQCNADSRAAAIAQAPQVVVKADALPGEKAPETPPAANS